MSGLPGHSRRPRKAAPVKNAVFIGAVEKGLKNLRKQKISERSTVASNGSYNLRTRGKRPRSGEDRSRNGKGGISHASVRMSTPLRIDQRSSSFRNEGTSMSSHNSEHVYHPSYDPFIEIRRANERLEQFRTKGNWAIDTLLSDDADEDLHRYEEKLKRRQSTQDGFTGEVELERRQLELLRRQRDIDIGKVTAKYSEYVLKIPKPLREKFHPRTPNKFRIISRRGWDGMIKKWRRHIHSYDDTSFNETWRSTASSVMSDTSVDLIVSLGSGDEAKSTPEVSTNQRPDDGVLNLPSLARGRGNWLKRRQPLPSDFDEDTLQELNKENMNNAGDFGNIKSSEEDTLHASDVDFRRSLRSRNPSKGTESSFALAADILHSGVSNDMTALKRPSAFITPLSDIDSDNRNAFENPGPSARKLPRYASSRTGGESSSGGISSAFSKKAHASAGRRTTYR